MTRATIDDIKNVIPTTKLGDSVITANITAASVLVDKIASGCASSLTEDELTQVEIYLSAHLVTVSDPGSSVSEEKFENSSRKFNTATAGKGVLGSPFGQTANMLSGGCLAELDKRKPQVFALGVKR